VEGERRERGESELWLSPKVPFWGVVRSRVEKGFETIVPGVQPRAEGGEKTTVTESVLISFRAAGAR
jgi:hypothetical protein